MSETHRSFQSQPENTPVSLIIYRPSSKIEPDPEDEVALVIAPRGAPEGGRERGAAMIPPDGGRERGATMTPEVDFAMVG